jgi:hypothetical protein
MFVTRTSSSQNSPHARHQPFDEPEKMEATTEEETNQKDEA